MSKVATRSHLGQQDVWLS